MYRVMKFFTDLQDNDHPYNDGDIFPREGIEVTENRLKELSGDSNKQGVPLIEEVVEEVETAEADQEEQLGDTEQPGEKEEPVEVEETEAKPVKPPRATRGRVAAKKE